MPTAEPPSYGVAIPLPGGEATKIAALLRQGDPPVIARIQEDRLVFDMRTLRDEELGLLAEAVCRALAGGAQGK
jgi:L-seryl-tRNA(Ser) seleniumtransferase